MLLLVVADMVADIIAAKLQFWRLPNTAPAFKMVVTPQRLRHLAHVAHLGSLRVEPNEEENMTLLPEMMGKPTRNPKKMVKTC